MRIVLADLASADGFVSKDTVAGGYGSRLRPFSRVTRVISAMKRRLHALPSVQLGYIAALCAAAGHDVVYTEGEPVEGDVGRRTHVARGLPARMRLGAGSARARAACRLCGTGGVKASGAVRGARRLRRDRRARTGDHEAGGRRTTGRPGAEPADRGSVDAPVSALGSRRRSRRAGAGPLHSPAVPSGGSFPLLASRGCPEFCTYCPHRILATYRDRPARNIVDELEYVTRAAGPTVCRLPGSVVFGRSRPVPCALRRDRSREG